MMVDEESAHPRGEALLRELLWVHEGIRNNLKTITAVLNEITSGAPDEQVRARLDDLAANSMLWTIRVNCMRYCSFVHGHHHHEDTAWFPALRKIDPTLHPVIDKLEADHVVVAKYLDDIEDSLARLADDESARSGLARALGELAEHLLAHLDYEEASLAPTLRRIRAWPPV